MNLEYFVSCPKGLEYLLENEAKSLRLEVDSVNPQGIRGFADLAALYRMSLWSRIANRIQIILFKDKVQTPEEVRALCEQFPWQDVFNANKSFAVEFHGSSGHFRNAMFGAQVVKDGIVDHFNHHTKTRPDVDKKTPDIRLHAYLDKGEITLSLDFTGYSLHQRGYRQKAGAAPLKENLAAALLLRANWPALAKEGYALLDPFCGSGTLVIEAAMMAANRAPGLLRDDKSFCHWNGHQEHIWLQEKQFALEQMQDTALVIQGSDKDKRLVAIANENAKLAGVDAFVQFNEAPLHSVNASGPKGLLISNPPFGERLEEVNTLLPLYQEMGQILHEKCQGWNAAILCSNPLLAKAIGLRSEKQYSFFNGPLACKLYLIAVSKDNQLKSLEGGGQDGLSAFNNRLLKNWQHMKKWAKRSNVHAYRIYDADLPEYAFAIDWYDGAVVVYEYAPPSTISEHKAQKRRLEMLQLLPKVLNIASDLIIFKERKPQKGLQQYQKMSQKSSTRVVQEGRAKCKVNLSDYVDTGLFLDHRPLRLKFAKLAPDSRFLNCFCYTASASVHAALAGALTTNVDLSNTYLEWAKENFALNRLDINKHQFVQFDCIKWLGLCKDRFDTIFLDPPSFSNSKRMDDTLDVQRDHEGLIHAAMRLLKKDGILYFSTNLRTFKLAESLASHYRLQNISAATIDEDFKRRPKIHCCFEIKALAS